MPPRPTPIPMTSTIRRDQPSPTRERRWLLSLLEPNRTWGILIAPWPASQRETIRYANDVIPTSRPNVWPHCLPGGPVSTALTTRPEKVIEPAPILAAGTGTTNSSLAALRCHRSCHRSLRGRRSRRCCSTSAESSSIGTRDICTVGFKFTITTDLNLDPPIERGRCALLGPGGIERCRSSSEAYGTRRSGDSWLSRLSTRDHLCGRAGPPVGLQARSGSERIRSRPR